MGVGQGEVAVGEVVEAVDGGGGFFVIHFEEGQAAGGDEWEVGMDLGEVSVVR